MIFGGGIRGKMPNFIYIFMIITLICIGAGIKAFNSEDSDTKTTIKNIPNGMILQF